MMMMMIYLGLITIRDNNYIRLDTMQAFGGRALKIQTGLVHARTDHHEN